MALARQLAFTTVAVFVSVLAPCFLPTPPTAAAEPSPSSGASGSKAAPAVPPGKVAESPRFLEEAYDIETPRLPAPMSLPEVSHPDAFAGITWITGLAVPNASSLPTRAIGLLRATGELHFGSARRVYVGLTYPMAAGMPVEGDTSSKVIGGNIEGHIRATFPQPTWLAAGLVLGVVAPTATFDRNGPAQSAANAAISLEPTDAIYFAPGTVALRPAFDVRVLRDRFLAQARQGLDVVLDVQGVRVAQTNARIVLHFGVLARKDLEASVEASQLYLFGSDVPDKRRSFITIGPNIRYSTRVVDLGAGFVTNLFSAYAPTIDQVWGLRLSVLGHF
ncbi:hypothetical protein AKJ09_00124 [Labilithrix luteola]|uniref:Transporter n=1 Tax=Labilithrix luteola TaxID=1391654 RepID=A0A0K1PIW2_9BACT|nr:hypothetical protein [Labilithrix luteola]AKU93460.1 hypothetical protein AKJ09_00124 [Labilithrix luteola]